MKEYEDRTVTLKLKEKGVGASFKQHPGDAVMEFLASFLHEVNNRGDRQFTKLELSDWLRAMCVKNDRYVVVGERGVEELKVADNSLIRRCVHDRLREAIPGIVAAAAGEVTRRMEQRAH